MLMPSFRPVHNNEGKYSDKVTNEQISKVLRVGMRTIDRVKKKFVEEGFEASMERRITSRVYEKKSDGDAEAKLVTLCKMVELNYVESISHVTVRTVLKKTNLNPGKQKAG
jgi:transposase